jgi:hypothetical protein
MDALAKRLQPLRIVPPFDVPAMDFVSNYLKAGLDSPPERNRMLATWELSIPMRNLVGLKFTDEQLSQIRADMTPREIWNL